VVRRGKKLVYAQMDSTTRAMNLWTRAVSDDQRELLVDVSALKIAESDPVFKYTSWQLSPDETQILFVSAPPEKQYLSRLTPAGNLFLYNLRTRSFKRLTNVSEPQYNQKFSPDGKTVAFVRGNNIYALTASTGEERQLTDDGSEVVINGKFDWCTRRSSGFPTGSRSRPTAGRSPSGAWTRPPFRNFA